MYDYDDIVVEMVPALHRKAFEMGLHDNSNPVLETWQGHLQYECEEEIWWSVFDELMKEGWYYNTPAAKGILEGMQRLKAAGHRIHILTARGFMQHADEIRKATYKNIEQLQLPVDTITFNKNKVQGMAEALRNGWVRDGERIISPKFDFAIDDGQHNYEHLDDAGVRVYLLELPHNEEWRWYHPTARTVKSVDQYVDIILKESA